MPEADPYVWPGSSVLRNRLGLRSQGELAEAEYALTLQRRLELESDPIRGNFDLAHLCAIHRHLFQDLFEWAGEIRTVDLAKGTSTFLPARRIPIGAPFAFQGLDDGPLLDGCGVPDGVFVDELSDALDRINYLHPFREGNGRTQRAFLDQVAGRSGRVLTWRNVTDVENQSAAVASVSEGRSGALRALVAKAVLPPLAGLAGFDLDSYRVRETERAGAIEPSDVLPCRRCGKLLDTEESIARGFHLRCWEARYQ